MRKNFILTSESVTDGHPDKLCDQISDAIVDEFMSQDPCARVRAECAVSSAIIFIAGRFATSAKVDLPHVARRVIKRIGYNQPEFNSKTCSIITAPQGFPPDKKFQFDEYALTEKELEKIAATSQVTVFGFACSQPPELMPFSQLMARSLCQRLSEVRNAGILPYLMPDGKVQVGIEYKERQPYRLHSVTVIAGQKNPRKGGVKALREDMIETVIEPVFETADVRPDGKTLIFVNPEGPFVGGPSYHSGLTGRKNAVDTYGEYARHGGHALSGKDPSRIDRAGAYAARYAAKNVVAAGLAAECEIMISYSLGFSRPVSLQVYTFDTGKIPEERIRDLINEHFDFRLGSILREFGLRHIPSERPDGFYQYLAAFGHFGRGDMELPWEKTDRAEKLAEAL